MNSVDIKQIIDEMPNLPTMPTIVVEALNIIGNPKSNINQLSEIISKDISMTTQILKLVNSAYYGFPSQITTINKAMALLGLNQVKGLIMSVATKPMMMTYCGKNLWEHSIRCAVGCQIISKSLGVGQSDEAFVMGLLHDIGKTVFEIYNKEALNEIHKLVGLGADRLTAEKMMFGFTHTEIGQELVLKWKLPVIIGTCVRYHHEPQKSEVPSTAGMVYVADRVAQDQLKYPILDPDIIDSLDFEIPDPQRLREEIITASLPIINALSSK